MIYTAGSRSLAILEMLVHLEKEDLLSEFYVLFQVEFPEKEICVLNDALPSNWADAPPPLSTRTIGDEWARGQESLVLEVPSAVVGGESNYLINPAHSEMSALTIHDPEPLVFDPRLLQ